MKKNILILDNDECLGYFGMLSGLYSTLVGRHSMRNRLVVDSPVRQEAEQIFRGFAVDLLNIGFARPALRDFFKSVDSLKKKGHIDYVVMYTSASRYSNRSEQPYMNWVGMLRSIFEHYAGAPIYDLDHSGRSDEQPQMEAPDGATLKSVGRIISRLGLTKDQVGQVMFIDDRPHNVECQENCDSSKVFKLGVSAYMYLPKVDRIGGICKKWDDTFVRAGMEAPSRYFLDYYREDAEDLISEGRRPGGVRKDI